MPNVLRQRLRNQQLTRSDCRTPAEVVAWFGAMQAQDYGGAKWAIGLRADGLTDALVDRAFNDGAILRTHVLRPTWHFVAPADIRWLLMLSAPRVHTFNASLYRSVELDRATRSRGRKVIARALGDGGSLTRVELQTALSRAGLVSDGVRLAYFMMHAELEGVVCSGPRRGKQFTYALLDVRAPHANTLSREEALSTLTWRYFRSHGPATLRDYAWWSGLTMREARTGIDMLGHTLLSDIVDSRTYWCPRSPVPSPTAATYLLPNYDEYLIAYKDRALTTANSRDDKTATRGPDPFVHHLVVDGRLAGSWRRTMTSTAARVEVAPYAAPSVRAQRAIDAARARYVQFMTPAVGRARFQTRSKTRSSSEPGSR